MHDAVSELLSNPEGAAPLDFHERLLTEAGTLSVADPPGSVRLLVGASAAAVQGGEIDDARAAAERALAVATRSAPSLCASARLALACALLIQGHSDEAHSLLDSLISRLADEELGDQADRIGAMLLWNEQYDVASEVLERIVDAGRRANRPHLIARPLDTLAAVDFRRGHWRRAGARSREALRLARMSANPFDIGSALTTQARIAAACGQETLCVRLLDEARALAVGGDLVATYAATAQALLDLSLDRLEAVIGHLEPLRRHVLSRREPIVFQWEPDLIEAYVRTGRRRHAASLLVDFEDRVRESRRAWALAAASRCRGLLEPSDEAEQHLLLALRRHDDVPMPFERARTELCFGERLRRMRRVRDARTHLQSALATFERLGAAPWAARARRELLTRTKKSASTRIETLLTPHELEVATLVARGATNREAAAALFVSPKTIEYHLASIYRKLGIRSRTELAGLVAGLRY